MKDTKVGLSVALSKANLAIVEACEGKNLSHKLSYLIGVYAQTNGVIARVLTDSEGEVSTEAIISGALLIYHRDPSQHYWENRETLPVTVKQKQGPEAAAELIKGAGWLTQIIDVPEAGITELWAAPAPAARDEQNCTECKRRVVEALSCD